MYIQILLEKYLAASKKVLRFRHIFVAFSEYLPTYTLLKRGIIGYFKTVLHTIRYVS